MNANNLLAQFEQLLEVDPDSWRKKPWLSDEDDMCLKLMAEFSELPHEEYLSLANSIGDRSIDGYLRLFAMRLGKSATSRRDLVTAYRAVSLSRIRERNLVEPKIDASAKALGVSSKKIKRELSKVRRGN